MPDLDALKSRVERAERHLDAAREARESQGAALVEMWRQIRDHFATQEREIEDYRARLAALEDEHAELLRQVEELLVAVERSVGRAGEETVPKIADMAQALLDGEEVVEIDDEPLHPATDASTIPESAPESGPEAELPPLHARADREVRGLVERVEDAHVVIPAAPDPDRDPDAAARDDIDDLRAELAELHVRLGNKRA